MLSCSSPAFPTPADERLQKLAAQQSKKKVEESGAATPLVNEDIESTLFAGINEKAFSKLSEADQISELLRNMQVK